MTKGTGFCLSSSWPVVLHNLTSFHINCKVTASHHPHASIFNWLTVRTNMIRKSNWDKRCHRPEKNSSVSWCFHIFIYIYNIHIISPFLREQPFWILRLWGLRNGKLTQLLDILQLWGEQRWKNKQKDNHTNRTHKLRDANIFCHLQRCPRKTRCSLILSYLFEYFLQVVENYVLVHYCFALHKMRPLDCSINMFGIKPSTLLFKCGSLSKIPNCFSFHFINIQ